MSEKKTKFDGRVFIGLMLGLGTVSGMGLKLWWSIGENVPPFWLWAVPVLFLGLGAVVWWHRKKERAQIAERIERSARVPRRNEPEPPPEQPHEHT